MLSSQLLLLNENTVGFAETEEVVAFKDKLEDVGVFKTLDVERSE